MLSEQTKGVGSLVFLSFGFGMIAVLVRYLGTTFTLYQQLYLTLGTAFLLSIIFFKKKIGVKKLQKISKRDWLVIAFRVTAGYIFGASLYRQSLILTKIANVVFIQSLPMVAVFGFLLFGEKITLKKVSYILAAYVGVILIATKDFSSIFSLGQGEIFSFIATALFAISFISRKWMSDRLDNQEITQILIFFGFLSLFIISLLNGEMLPTSGWTLTIGIAVFLVGLFNAINQFFINYGFQKVKAVLASNILTLESVFSVILAIIFYQEFPSLKELAGGIIIVVSAIQMNKLENKK